MHFLRSSSVCVLLPIDIYFGCSRIKLDINGIASYCIAYKIYRYIIQTRYTAQPYWIFIMKS